MNSFLNQYFNIHSDIYSMKKQHGFTLLEAIVSLVLIAGVGMALFSWINTNLISLHRIQQTQSRHDATRNALAFIRSVNPLETPQGEETLGIYTFEWQSTAVQLPKDVISSAGAVGLFQIGLYEMQITVYKDDELITTFTVRHVGYKQVREPPDFF